MTITLPLPLRTYQYRPLTVFSLLDTDTDRVLPVICSRCASRAAGPADRGPTPATTTATGGPC